MIRGTTKSCLSLLADPASPVRICDFVQLAEQWLSLLGQPLNFAAAKAPGLSGRAVPYVRVRHKLHESSIEKARYVELMSMPPDDARFAEAPIYASINSRREILLAVDTLLPMNEGSWLMIAERMHSALPFVYSYQYALPYSVGPGHYASGIVHGSIDDFMHEHEKELRTRWSHVLLSPEKNPPDQSLRQVYSLQILSEGHLHLKIQGVTLREWIDQSTDRGRLRPFLANLWVWSVPDEQNVDDANLALFEAGLLKAWDPKLAEKA
jgi:hypothetical protein